MHPKKTLLAALLVATPFSTMAAAPAPSAHLDVYYVDSSADDGLDDDGSGFGARVGGKVADNLKVYAEYQTVNYDDSDADLDQIRAGLGYTFSQSGNVDLYGKVEFVNAKLDGGGADESESGFGVHGGLGFAVTPDFKLNAQVGYIDLNDFGDGLEYKVGGSFNVTPAIAIIADYRVTDLEDGDFGAGSFDQKIEDLRAGVRFSF